MWSPGAFHQLSPTNPTGQHTISQPAGTPNQFLDFLPTTTVATSTVTASTATTGPVQQDHLSQGQLSSPHWSPSASSNSTSPVSNPPDNTEEEQPDPLVSALSFLTADSNTNATNASSLVTTKGNVLHSSLREHPHWLQLNESMFRPVTPVRVDRLEQMLVGHPNHKLV